jgi:hypothetical protein
MVPATITVIISRTVGNVPPLNTFLSKAQEILKAKILLLFISPTSRKTDTKKNIADS